MMIRIWASLCIILSAASMGTAVAFIGNGSGELTEKLKVKGCRSYQDSDAVALFMESGSWSIEAASGYMSGVYDTIKQRKQYDLHLDETSRYALMTFLEEESDNLCDLEPGSSTISNMVIGKFSMKLNKKMTRAKVKLNVTADRSDGVTGGKVSYKTSAVINFNAFDCTAEPFMRRSWLTAVTTPDLNADNAVDIVFTQNTSKFKLTDFNYHNGKLEGGKVKTIIGSQVVVYMQDPFNPGVFRREKDIVVLPESRTKIQFYYGLPSIADGDLNGDGLVDIAVPEQEENRIGILLQDPGNPGQFRQPVHIPATPSPVDVAIGDLNGDGVNDMVVAGSELTLLSNDIQSSGPEFHEQALGIGNTTSVAIGDIDRDGRNDIATTRGDTVIVLFQDPEPASPGSFTFSSPYATGAEATDVAIGDLNGDSLPDLAVANRGSANGSVSVHLQDPVRIGEFFPGAHYQTDEGSRRVRIHDLNRDGLPDLAVANNDYDGGSVSVLLQNDMNHGEFLEAVNYSGLHGPYDVAPDDINGDGFADLVMADKCRHADKKPYVRHQEAGSPGNFLSPVFLP